MPTHALHQTLAMVGNAMRGAGDEWWIIGSAAVALHGAPSVTVADVDVLTSEADAHHISTTLGIVAPPGIADARFRSRVFTIWQAPPLAVEFMGGFEVRSTTGWSPVLLATRVPIQIDGETLYIPDRAELIALLHRFGRPKDLARAALLA